MNIAIYSRKSKFSETGESVENQIQYCKSYAAIHLPSTQDITFCIYEDEGFSAATSMRPQFQKLLSDIRNGKIQLLMCYRLDRITRKVSDFSETLELLEKMNVGFISATENFDTSTPMGKAMIYIASVFAQLERETIAERVRDNMLALSKTGRWLGGLTPMGYASKEIIYLDSEFRERKLYQLVSKEEELHTVTLLFYKYQELGSLSAVENYCFIHGIKSQKDCFFSKGSIAKILENPTYCIGDQDAYAYFSSLGCCITSSVSEFNSDRGILCYNRTNQQTKNHRRKRPPTEWIIALGKHQGIISGKLFTETQAKLKKNKEKASPRKDTSAYSIVSGKILCLKCGSKMRIKNIRKENKITRFSYACERKMLTKGVKCNTPNINGAEFDKALIETLWEYLQASLDYNQVISLLKAQNTTLPKTDPGISIQKALEKEKASYQNEIDQLINQLSRNPSSLLEKYLLPKLSELDRKINDVSNRLALLSKSSEELTWPASVPNLHKNNPNDLAYIIKNADIPIKKALVNALIDSIEWDGNAAYLNFHTSNGAF